MWPYTRGMTETPSLDDVLGELPQVAHDASRAVLDLYLAIRQARCMGATYDQLVRVSGLPRGTVQNIVDGRLPKFSVDKA